MFIIGVIECDLFQHLKHRYMKGDIQIVKLSQKTEPYLVKSILLHSLGDGWTKFWNSVGMGQIRVMER